MKAEKFPGLPSPRNPRFATLLLLTLMPLLAALGTGLWLSAQLRPEESGRSSDSRLEETVTQEKLLSEAFWLSVDRLRTEARAFAALGRLTGLSMPIVAAFEFQPSSSLGPARKRAGAPGLSREDSDAYESASRAVDRRELSANAVAVLPARSGHLGFGFESAARDAVIVIWVPAAAALAFFDRWARRSQGGTLRGYLIDRRGLTLASSGGALAGAEGAVRALFEQNVLSGAQAGPRSALAYSRLGSLPWATVVQRETPPEAPIPLLTRALSSPLFQAGAQGLVFLVAFYFVFSLWLRRLWVLQQQSPLASPAGGWVDLSRDWESDVPSAVPFRPFPTPDSSPLVSPASKLPADHDHTV